MKIKKDIKILLTIIIIIFGLSYAAVPLYNLFCSQTGYGGKVESSNTIPTTKILTPLEIHFTSQVDPNMPIAFTEEQTFLKILPGETILAFYSSTNLTDHEIFGISTYNVSPAKAAKYLKKIQCFCFDEQRWTPHETIHMPILFYIDPLISQDPLTQNLQSISLNYTFYNTSDTK